MSALGLTVEDMTLIGDIVDGVVLAKVLDLRPHPAADKIQLVDVDAGDGEARQVCCGAFNMAVGDLIPFATPGTVMSNGLKILQRKMRGEVSSGMCCSGAELGLSDDHEGILVLNDRVVPEAELGMGCSRCNWLGTRCVVGPRGECQPSRRHVGSGSGSRSSRRFGGRLLVP